MLVFWSNSPSRALDNSQDLLDKRDVTEYNFENAQNTLIKRENERSSLETSDGKAGLGSFFSSKNPELLKQEKLDKLATQIAEVPCSRFLSPVC